MGHRPWLHKSRFWLVFEKASLKAGKPLQDISDPKASSDPLQLKAEIEGTHKFVFALDPSNSKTDSAYTSKHEEPF